jgi:hypothetical protein
MNLDYLDNYNVFCTYNYNDPEYKNYCMIVKSYFNVRNDMLEDDISCKTTIPSDLLKPSGYFISFDSGMRPITENMALITFKSNKAYPYEVQDIIVEYDLFVSKEPQDISTIVYISPVKNTIPIYIYRLKSNGNIVLHYNRSSYNESIMTPFSIPIIYVLKEPYQYFDLTQGLCIPTKDKKYELDDCISQIKTKFEAIDTIKSEEISNTIYSEIKKEEVKDEVKDEKKDKLEPRPTYWYVFVLIIFVSLFIAVARD